MIIIITESKVNSNAFGGGGGCTILAQRDVDLPSL